MGATEKVQGLRCKSMAAAYNATQEQPQTRLELDFYQL